MNRMLPSMYRAACAIALCEALACEKKADSLAAPVTTAVTAAPAPASATLVEFAFAAESKISVELEAPKEHIKADASSVTGSVRLDLSKLANSRGEVKVDLTKLTFHTFEEAGKNTSQTEHALNWLEVGTLVDAPTRSGNQFAVFAIQSVDGVSEGDVSRVPSVAEATGDVRTVSLTAHGDFLIHGRKVTKDVPLLLKFHYAKGAEPAARPVSVAISTPKPLQVTLADHDVKPRDNFGKIAQWTTNLVSKVATNADVTLALTARPR